MTPRGSITAKVLAAILFAAAAAMPLGCGRGAPSASEPVVEVETTPAKIETIAQLVTAEGLLYPIHQASLSPKISAPVRRFYVNRGDHVHRGQLLAVLDHRDLEAAVVSAQGSYDQAKANYRLSSSATLPEEMQKAQLGLKDAQASLAAQQAVYQSEEKLFQEGAIARRQLDQTRVALTAAESVYESAKKHLANLEGSGAADQQRAAQGQMESTRGQYLAAQAQLAYSELRSPIDGVIAERSVYPGDMAPAGTPLLVVMDTAKLIVRLHVPQPQAVLLKLGDVATLDVPGTGAIPAKVTVLSPALDPNSTTVEVWVEATNPQGRLQPGTSVQVSITARKVPGALVIPSSAILNGPDGEMEVMIVESDGRGHLQAVETGIRQGPLVEILKGLHAGDEVIVNGAYGLPDKTRVKALPAGSNAGSPGRPEVH